MDFLTELYSRNTLLFYFGLFNFAFAMAFFLFSRTTDIEIMGVNAWYKPIKFALSIGIYTWTMAWFMYYLPPNNDIRIASWLIVLMLGFEIIYISIQANRGELSHFNQSTPIYTVLYNLMAIAATVVSLVTAYICLRFFQADLMMGLPDYYVWAIRWGLLLFVIFSLEGFVMGSRLSHTIGGPDGGDGLPFLNWSKQYGDPRIAHFIGMHALQLLPLMAYYWLKDIKWTFLVVVLYTLLAVYVLVQALNGRPFWKLME